ncbi:choice-of-anchor E domain-containing protein [Alteromonas gilva]|uniref:Choice-of-anchor E domain-containing protein n=1 Tax=Alteromonas gilva TaxID=2987522 RepID=A0ABT5L2H1_9ALTE|nr:choice-of-anchor E domain-containing protein [Alteromonas gilva]MDC8831243.1 choice-of-anchor E domain-containing protein [Alteromonas gilva]
MFKKVFFLLALTVTGAANAALVTDSVSSIAEIFNKETSTTTDPVYSAINIDQFDDNGGMYTLTGVELVFRANTSGNISVKNDGTSTASFEVGAWSRVWFYEDTAASAVASLTSFPPEFKTALNVQGGETRILGPFELIVSSTIDYGLSDDLGDFIGNGTIDYFMNSVSDIMQSSAGNYTSKGSFDTDASIEYTYTYTYEDTPPPLPPEAAEPETLGIFAAVLVFMGMASRNRKKA